MHDIPANKKDEAFQVVSRLREAGFRAFIAGGAVRDMVMGVEPEDYDIATDATPDDVARLFDRVRPVGAAFGVSLVMTERNTFEVAMFRTEGAYADGRRPDSVERADEREDVRRRDFTINALLYDPTEDRVIDHTGGITDIRAGIIRAVGDPGTRMIEDRLRMLRAVRFAARLGFGIEPATMAAIREGAAHVTAVSRERIGDELSKMFTGKNPERALSLLDESGLLAAVLPEIAAMKGVAQPPEYHPEGDVFEHTRRMLSLFGGGTRTMAFAVLLHDVGKPAAFSYTDRVRFNGHDEIGARMAEEILRRLRFDGDTVARVRELVRKHMRFLNVPQMRESTLRRFMALPEFPELLELHRLDCIASTGNLDTCHFLMTRIENAAPEETRTLPPPLIGGDELIAMGMTPGPEFGRILREVHDAQLEGAISTRDAAVAWVRSRYSCPSRRQKAGQKRN